MDNASLDELDRQIIQALFINPRVPFAQLSAVLGPSEQTIARRYRQLYDSRVIRVVATLDTRRLGRSDWVVRIRCAPGSSSAVAASLAKHRDTSWVQLTSGGIEIFSTIHSHDRDRRTPLLLDQLSVGRQLVALDAYCLLHIFVTTASHPPVGGHLTETEIGQLTPNAETRTAIERPSAMLQDSDWPLVEALAEDGRSSYRQVASRTHWHESTVRRRVDELIGSGVLSFDVDLDSDAVGICSRAMLWLSVIPSELARVGEALASHPEIPFVAATTGPTNMVASLLCENDNSLYEYITNELSPLAGITHVEISPVMRAVKMHATMTPPSS